MLKYQQTLASSISFQGIGLHSGLKTQIKIKPGMEIKVLFSKGQI